MKNESNIEQSIKSFIMSEFLPDEDPTQLKDTTPLLTTGVLDSIATLKLVLFLEKHFSITMEAHEADAEHLDTIELIAKFVRSKS